MCGARVPVPAPFEAMPNNLGARLAGTWRRLGQGNLKREKSSALRRAGFQLMNLIVTGYQL